MQGVHYGKRRGMPRIESASPLPRLTTRPPFCYPIPIAQCRLASSGTPVWEGSAMGSVSINVNGVDFTREVEPRLLFVHFLRDVLGLTGTHVGCDTSQCGACTVLVDGEATKSCTLFAVQLEGRKVTTIEGIAQNGKLHPVQQAFWDKHGLQCGFCTPGMIMTTCALLDKNPKPTEEQI